LPLRERFGFSPRLDYYSVQDLSRIVGRSAGILAVRTDEEGAGEHRARDVEDEERLRVLPALDGLHLADDGLRRREREERGAHGKRDSSSDQGGGPTGGQTEHAAERSRPALGARCREKGGDDGDGHERGERAEERERSDGH